MPYQHNSRQSTSTKQQCPCTKMVRDSNMICQISDIWWPIPLPLTMYPIVEVMASPPAMNMHSQKHYLPQDHPFHQYFKDGMVILDTWYYFFTYAISTSTEYLTAFENSLNSSSIKSTTWLTLIPLNTHFFNASLMLQHIIYEYKMPLYKNS